MTIDRETELLDQLAALHRRYYDEAQPIIDELTKIELMKPPKPMLVPIGPMGESTLNRIREEQRWLIQDAKREMDAVTKLNAAIKGHAITRTWADEEGKIFVRPTEPDALACARAIVVCGSICIVVLIILGGGIWAALKDTF